MRECACLDACADEKQTHLQFTQKKRKENILWIATQQTKQTTFDDLHTILYRKEKTDRSRRKLRIFRATFYLNEKQNQTIKVWNFLKMKFSSVHLVSTNSIKTIWCRPGRKAKMVRIKIQQVPKVLSTHHNSIKKIEWKKLIKNARFPQVPAPSHPLNSQNRANDSHIETRWTHT